MNSFDIILSIGSIVLSLLAIYFGIKEQYSKAAYYFAFAIWLKIA